MFDRLKKAWQEAVVNFHREMQEDGDAGSGDPAAAMWRDLRAARAGLRRVQVDLAETLEQLKAEREGQASCRRREELARGIGDEETARIAADYAGRHAERAGVLARKAEALEAERGLRQRDLAEMETAAEAARLEVSETGTTHPGRIEEHEPLDRDDVQRFDRMQRDAREREAQARLEELKRRMR